jgi:L-alanine-DL-glutamate epimerase-like enolase superfamily enzyme
VKISAIECFAASTAIDVPYRWRDGLPGSPPSIDTTWMRVATDAGVDGWAPIDKGAIGADLVQRVLAPSFVGLDALNREAAWGLAWEIDRVEEFPSYALGAVDIALWDIAGIVAGLPLYQLLGGYRDKIPAYASTATFASIEEYLDVADQCLQAGFRAIKLHAWGDARRDAQLSTALREHVGDDIDLMYDGLSAFRLPDAIYLGRALEASGYRWYEEPMLEFGTRHYAQLCDTLEIPILAPETADGVHYTAAQWLIDGAADLLRSGSDYRGITGSMRVAHLADSFHTMAEVHGGGHVSRHLACAVKNNSYYEAMILTNPIRVEPGIDADGCMMPPAGPGIGWDIDLQQMRRGLGPHRQ